MPDPALQRKIIHCDCDCFYAAIEMRDDPTLLGRPLAVGGAAAGRGVVATCNYEARAFGVHSAMPTREALRRCKDLVVVRPQMEKYRRASREIMAIYRRYTDRVEPLSLDEAYLDVTGARHCGGSATRMARTIKSDVHARVGITVSAGVAPNKFIAKIASDWNKPDGLKVVLPAEVDTFVAALPVERLFGVGAVTPARLRQAGFSTCADLRPRSRADLRQMFGALGERLFDLSRGIDMREVNPNARRKSLSVEETFNIDLKSLHACREEIERLLGELIDQQSKIKPGERIESVFVKIRFDDFRKTTVERRADSIDPVQVMELLGIGLARHARPVRLLGVGVRVAEDAGRHQLALFTPQSENGSPT